MLNRIEELRRERGWSQKDVADRAGTTQANIQRYETGASDMKVSMAISIANAFGVTVESLLGIDAMPAESEHLSDDELELVQRYRASNKQGRIAIQAVAVAMSSGKPGLEVSINATE